MAQSGKVLTARNAGLVGCRHCGSVSVAGTPVCPRCHGGLHSRFPASVQRTWAWWIAGLIAYVARLKDTAKLRPDMKLAINRAWGDPQSRLNGLFQLTKGLSGIVRKMGKAAS